MDLLPYKLFRKYYRPGFSLDDVLKGQFSLTAQHQGKSVEIKTPADKSDPYLKLINTAFIGHEHLGLKINIKNTENSFVIFVPATQLYKKKKTGAAALKKFKKVETLILEETSEDNNL